MFAAVKRSKKPKNLFLVILFLIFLPSCDAIFDSSIGGSHTLGICQQSRVVYHLHRHSGNSGWKINGVLIYCRPNWKITGINGSPGKVVLFDWLGHFNRFGLVPFTLFLLLVPVPGSSPHISQSFKSQNGRNAYCSN